MKRLRGEETDRICASFAREHSWRHAGRVHLPGAGDADRAGDWKHVARGGGYCARSAAKFSGQRERDRLRGKFLKAAEQMGLTGAEREETWMMVEKFAGFGFCKAHAATYADISYRMAYLKTHHPAEFLAAMCSAGAGFYHVSAYVEEAKRWGIEVRLPSVNHSRMEYTARGWRRWKSAHCASG